MKLFLTNVNVGSLYQIPAYHSVRRFPKRLSKDLSAFTVNFNHDRNAFSKGFQIIDLSFLRVSRAAMSAIVVLLRTL